MRNHLPVKNAGNNILLPVGSLSTTDLPMVTKGNGYSVTNVIKNSLISKFFKPTFSTIMIRYAQLDIFFYHIRMGQKSENSLFLGINGYRPDYQLI